MGTGEVGYNQPEWFRSPVSVAHIGSLPKIDNKKSLQQIPDIPVISILTA